MVRVALMEDEGVGARRVRPAIVFKVYGARVLRTETAVHIVFGRIRRDPDAKPCECRTCAGENRPVLEENQAVLSS